MITIVYNNSNVTLYRIPINSHQTKIFALPHQSDPQTLQSLINFFNHTTTNQTISSTVASTLIQTTNQCHTQNVLLIIDSLIILFLLFIFLIYMQRHQYRQSHKYDQPTLSVINDNKKNNDHRIHVHDNDSTDIDDDNDDDNEKGITMVSE
jgi:cytoskeletal protein RodZ